METGDIETIAKITDYLPKLAANPESDVFFSSEVFMPFAKTKLRQNNNYHNSFHFWHELPIKYVTNTLCVSAIYFYLVRSLVTSFHCIY